MIDGFIHKLSNYDYNRWCSTAHSVVQLNHLTVFTTNYFFSNKNSFIILRTADYRFKYALLPNELFDIIYIYDDVNNSGDYQKFLFYINEIFLET